MEKGKLWNLFPILASPAREREEGKKVNSTTFKQDGNVSLCGMYRCYSLEEALLFNPNIYQ